ncbi:LPXTG cell wall anchor domain-containing protein [Streptomyces sp. NPDC019890]|uniref:LPXTG cell wall anchor domain-containing protein n=1 Tax=Streptomyces sp. NPDC019890 TaxID=3365064 RepID=UPI00384AD5C5
MSARFASAAALTVAAAVGTTLVPLAAYAAPVASGKPLTIELGTPAPAGPLTRGGATETFTFTVKNSSDKAVDFLPWMVADSDGASPVASSHIVFDVEPVNAPATDDYVMQQDGSAQGLFYPAGKPKGDPFSVPAKGELSWKVSVGLGKKYPSNNGNLKLDAADLLNHAQREKDDTLVFETSPKVESGPASLRLLSDPKTPIKPGTYGQVSLIHQLKGTATFDSDLATTLEVEQGPDDTQFVPQLVVEELAADGSYIRATRIDGQNKWQLSDIGKNFIMHRTTLRVSVVDFKGIQKPLKLKLHASSSLTEGNITPFLGADGAITIAPERGTTTPGGTPSATPSATPSPTASASASPAPSASATDTATTGANTPGTTTGALASTGSSDTTWYAALAAALIGSGGVLIALRLRRR